MHGSALVVHDPRVPKQIVSPRTHPLWPIKADGTCACDGDLATTPKHIGKHPKSYGPPLEGGGYGIYTGHVATGGSGVFVVDADQKDEFTSGPDNFAELCSFYNEPLPDTLIISTGLKFGKVGFHFYLLCPEGMWIKNSVSLLAPGVDIRGEGGWVVGPGSMHVSGLQYQIVNDVPITKAPKFLLSWTDLYYSAGEYSSKEYKLNPVDPNSDEGRRRFISYTHELAGTNGWLKLSVDGNGGNAKFVSAIRRGLWYWNLSAEVIQYAIETYFNPRCIDTRGNYAPWESHEITRTIANQSRANPKGQLVARTGTWGDELVKLAVREDTPTFPEVAPPDPDDIPLKDSHDDQHAYDVRVGRDIPPTKTFPQGFAKICHILRNEPVWKGVLRWDEFFECVRAVDPPVALDAEKQARSESDLSSIKVWFEIKQFTQTSKESIRDAVELVAKLSPVHPIREYFKSLPVEPPSYLDDLPRILFGSLPEDIELDRVLLKHMLVGAVRRILHPGCQMDSVLILQSSKQGKHKSQFIKVLFGDKWVSQQMPDITKPDGGGHHLSVVWGQEIGEMHRFLRVDSNVAKEFITRCIDTFRKPYGHEMTARLRQCVFIGTTNEDEILRDHTGERRYHPVTVRHDIPIEWIRENRDRVWSAAYQLAMDETYDHYIEEGSIEETALFERQRGFKEEDSWQDIIQDYCAGRESVTAEQVYRFAIMSNAVDWKSSYSNREKKRITTVLISIGSLYKRVKDRRVYCMSDELRTAAPSAEEIRRRKASGELAMSATSSN